MKLQYLGFALMVVLFASSCNKEDKDCWDKKECAFCDEKDFPFKGKSDAYEDDKKDTGKNEGKDDGQEEKGCEHDIKEIIVEALVMDESCGCYVDGMVKYTKDNQTIALIKYHNPECTGEAIKVLCHDGDCESKKASCCTFIQECDSKSSTL